MVIIFLYVFSFFFLIFPKACSDKKLNCNFNMAPVWDPATMMKHLNVTSCWTNGTEGNAKVGMKWYVTLTSPPPPYQSPLFHFIADVRNCDDP